MDNHACIHEEENIRKVIEEWHPVIENMENGYLVIIDIGSKDDTYRIM